jgi:KDO2-lipid IV(A) lauroyltransferase
MAKRKNKIRRRFKKYRRKVRYRSIYYLLRFLIFTSTLIPRKAWIKTFGWLGGLGYYIATYSAKMTIKHLTMVYGKEKSPDEIKVLAKQVFRMMGMNGADLIRAFRITERSQYEKVMITKGVEHAEAAMAKGKGVMFLTAHLGAFEFLGMELAFRGFKPLIVGTPLKDEKLNDLLWENRIKLGATAVERGKDMMKIIKNLKSGGSMIILIDQDTKVKSRFINFLGLPCATPVGASIIAMKTGAAVVPVMTHLRDDLKQEFNYYPQLQLVNTGNEETDLVTNTQMMSDAGEMEIRKYPSQWVWMHESWKTKPGEEIV